jgi:hypothetical protein
MFSQTNIRSIKIPDGIKTIGDNSFFGCRLLEKIEFSSKSQLQKIEQSAFGDCSINSINLPNSLIEIETQAFNRCTSLSVFSLFSSENPADGLKFNNYCFKDCNLMANFIFTDKGGAPDFNDTPGTPPLEDCGKGADPNHLFVQGNNAEGDSNSFAYKF